MELTTTTEALAAFCKRASKFDFATVDTEFLRETTYWPKLCLLQAATPEEAILVDPLADGLSLQPFFDLLANDKVVKVFHAARQDIEIFVKLSGRVPANIFDTQIAASVCGFGDSVSYDNLVRSVTGVDLDKSSRFTDWSHRPLTEKQRLYALADVTHLRDIYVKLRQQVTDTHRWDWVEDELDVLRSIDTYVVKPENAWERLKSKLSRPRDLAALQSIAAWRERRAQDGDQPRSRVLKDDALIEIWLLQLCRNLLLNLQVDLGARLPDLLRSIRLDGDDQPTARQSELQRSLGRRPDFQRTDHLKLRPDLQSVAVTLQIRNQLPQHGGVSKASERRLGNVQDVELRQPRVHDERRDRRRGAELRRQAERRHHVRSG